LKRHRAFAIGKPDASGTNWPFSFLIARVFSGSSIAKLYHGAKRPLHKNQEHHVAKKAKKVVRREWTKEDIKELKTHSKAKTPVVKISKATKRTIGALRAKAVVLGIGLGHQR
jgi:hypothetical protein